MRHRRASRLVLVAWLATAVLLGSACSSDDDATPNATATTTSEPADPAGPSTTAGPGAASIAEVVARRAPMGAAARSHVEERYSMTTVAAAWSALLDDVVSERAGGRSTPGT